MGISLAIVWNVSLGQVLSWRPLHPIYFLFFLGRIATTDRQLQSHSWKDCYLRRRPDKGIIGSGVSAYSINATYPSS